MNFNENILMSHQQSRFYTKRSQLKEVVRRSSFWLNEHQTLEIVYIQTVLLIIINTKIAMCKNSLPYKAINNSVTFLKSLEWPLTEGCI